MNYERLSIELDSKDLQEFDDFLEDDFQEIEEEEEKEKLGLFSGVSMIIGMMVGSGIFSSPSLILQFAGSIGMSLVVWTISGILALFGAVSYAELGTLIPKSGGEQAYLLRVYGKYMSFLFVWFSCLIGKPSSIAIIIYVFSEYFIKIINNMQASNNQSTESLQMKLVACSLTIILTLINLYSSKSGVILQNISTVLKLMALLLIALLGLFFHFQKPQTSLSNPLFENTSSNPGSLALALYQGNTLFIILGLWAFDGWNNLNLLTGELKNPSQILPLSIFISIPLVLILYLLVNMAYFSILTTNEILESSAIALSFGNVTLGKSGAILFSVCVLISTIGSANASIYSSARLIQASANDKLLPFSTYLSKINNSLIVQGILVLFFILTGTYQSLINFYSFIIWFFYFFTVLGTIILRHRSPEKSWNRPFKSSLIFSYLFLLSALLLIFVPLIQKPFLAVSGIGVLFLLSLIYYIKYKKSF